MASFFKNKKSHKEEHQFPETLAGFGYEFNKGKEQKRGMCSCKTHCRYL